MTIGARDEFEANHPELFQVIGSAPLIDPTKLGMKKPHSEFREVLQRVQKAHPLSKGINSY